MKFYNLFLENLSKKLGLTIKEIFNKDPIEMRKYLSNKLKIKFKVSSNFLYKGISREELNKDIDEILK